MQAFAHPQRGNEDDFGFRVRQVPRQERIDERGNALAQCVVLDLLRQKRRYAASEVLNRWITHRNTRELSARRQFTALEAGQRA